MSDINVVDWLFFVSLAGCVVYGIICRLKIVAHSSAPVFTKLTAPLMPTRSLDETGLRYQRRLILTTALGLIVAVAVLLRQGEP